MMLPRSVCNVPVSTIPPLQQLGVKSQVTAGHRAGKDDDEVSTDALNMYAALGM